MNFPQIPFPMYHPRQEGSHISSQRRYFSEPYQISNTALTERGNEWAMKSLPYIRYREG
jgi:hypothetical protein